MATSRGCPRPPSHLSGRLPTTVDFYPEDNVRSIFSSQGMSISPRILGCPEVGLLV